PRISAALGLAWAVVRRPGDAIALARDGLRWSRALRAAWRDHARAFKAPLPVAAGSGREAAEG
ncbi:MAG TPA: hypothetical protein VFK85_07435, partial [Anaeromyxobacteraceae bacterium]|nr:hypothetical protein [Anaeromyxobacteraceae bacterium]